MMDPFLHLFFLNWLIFVKGGNHGLVIGCNTNVHHTNWESSDRNQREVDLAEFLAGVHTTWCNVGNTLTFQVANKRQVLDLTLINDRISCGLTCQWYSFLVWSWFLRFDIAIWLEGGRFVRVPKAVNWGLNKQKLSKVCQLEIWRLIWKQIWISCP